MTFCKEPKSKNEIKEHLGISSERYIRQKLIVPLLEEGRLVRTIPEKLSSLDQRYRSRTPLSNYKKRCFKMHGKNDSTGRGYSPPIFFIWISIYGDVTCRRFGLFM